MGTQTPHISKSKQSRYTHKESALEFTNDKNSVPLRSSQGTLRIHPSQTTVYKSHGNIDKKHLYARHLQGNVNINEMLNESKESQEIMQ
jgi:hypothetical protein